MKNYSLDAETEMLGAITANGLIPPAHIIADENIHWFDGKRLHGNRRDCWYAASDHLVPVLVGGAPGIEFDYEHSSLPVAFTERLLINAKILELKSKHKKVAA